MCVYIMWIWSYSDKYPPRSKQLKSGKIWLREIPVLRFLGIGDILPQYLRYYKDLEPKKLVLFHLMWTLFYGRHKFWTESKFWSWSRRRFLLGQLINSFGLHTGISMGSHSESICFIIAIFLLYLNNFSDYRKIFVVSY